MQSDPFDRKPSDPFARQAAGKRAEDAKKPALSNTPSVTTVIVSPPGDKPPLPANAGVTRQPDRRLLLTHQL
jgi:hypothetical protein